MKFSLDQLRRELEHELEDRTRRYPRLIRENRLNRERARRKLLRLRQVLQLLRALSDREFDGLAKRLEEAPGGEDPQLMLF